MPESLLIRADATAHMGTGHVMRCIALGQAWQRAQGRVVFAQAQSTPALERRLRAEEFEFIRIEAEGGSQKDATITSDLARQSNSRWIVADGYHFDAAYQERIKAAGQRLLVVDDYGHADRYCADFVLNQNLGADATLYPQHEPHTQFLFGPRYCLLRREFLKWREWERDIPPRASKILITLGGSDPDNVTGKVIEAVKLLRDVEAVAVVGGSNPHLDNLRTISNDSSVQLIVNSAEMPTLMAEADLAVTAGGTTVWELAFMGLPALTIVLAQNQQSNGDQLEKLGLARNLGWHAELSPQRIAEALEEPLDDEADRREMSRRGRALVDGLGSFRVWLHLHGQMLGLRRATDEDSRLIWEWANQSEVRAVSFHSEPIPWESHTEWFETKLSDANCHFWLGTNGEHNPVGQVRFDVDEGEATISVSLDSSRRGRGVGALLIWTACRKLFCEAAIAVIHAYIKPDNAISIRAFEKAGFERIGAAMVQECAALHLQLRRATVET